MKKFKTNKLINVQTGRGNKLVIVRMIVSHFSIIDLNNIKVEGYYYYLTDDSNPSTAVKLPESDFGQNSLRLWDDIIALENMENSPLANLCSTRNLKDVLLQRLEELTKLQLGQESGMNYGTLPGDWIIDND